MMDDDPLEFEVDREGVRRYLTGPWIFALYLPGVFLVGTTSGVIATALFGGSYALIPFLGLIGIIGAGLAFAAVRLAYWLAESGAASLRYWIDAGGNLRVNSGFIVHRRLSIPMDRIEAITLGQNLFMRWCRIWVSKVQFTGGQGRGSSVTLLGLKSPEKVRDILLDERRKALRDLQAERYA